MLGAETTSQDPDRISPERALRMVVQAAHMDPAYPRYSQGMFFAIQSCEEALGDRLTWTQNLREWMQA